MRNFKFLVCVSVVIFSIGCKSQKAEEQVYSSDPVEQRNRPSNGEKGQKGERPDGPPSADALIKKMDANGDGVLSQSEVKGKLAEDFSSIDTDNDGVLSKLEIENAPRPERGQKSPR